METSKTLIGTNLPQISQIRIKKVYFFLFLAAILIKFLLLPLPGHFSDLYTHQGWGNFLIKNSPTEIYTKTACNLPPFWVYILWFFSQIHFLITGTSIYLISEILKIPAVLADIAIGLVIFWFLLKRGYKEKVALIAGLFFILNPFVIYNSSVWGQLDSIYTLFALLAFIFLDQKKTYLGAIFLAISFLTKLQGVIFIPLFFFFLVKKYPWQKIFLAFSIFVLTIFIIILPFLISGTSPLFIFQKTWLRSWHQSPFLSLNSFNLWWLPQMLIFQSYPTKFLYFAEDFLFFGSISFKTIGLILFSLFYLLIFLNRKKNIFFLASLVSLMFFMLPTAMHERYLFPFFAFFSVFWPKEKKYFWPYLFLSLISFLNLLFAIPNTSEKLARTIFEASFLLSLVNLSVFFYLFISLFKEKNYDEGINHPANL